MPDLKQVVERHIAAFNARDEAGYPWTADFEFVVPGTTLKGREESLAFVRGFWEAFPDARIELVRLISEDPWAQGGNIRWDPYRRHANSDRRSTANRPSSRVRLDGDVWAGGRFALLSTLTSTRQPCSDNSG